MIDPNFQDDIDALPDVENWFQTGVEKGATHMIICCDPSYSDDNLQPIYVMPNDDYGIVENNLWRSGHVIGSYDLSRPFRKQENTYKLKDLDELSRDYIDSLDDTRTVDGWGHTAASLADSEVAGFLIWLEEKQ